jgi:hypothetical protein
MLPKKKVISVAGSATDTTFLKQPTDQTSSVRTSLGVGGATIVDTKDAVRTGSGR